ncbi:MAG: succinate dehydrogenase, cytochrome b556 subunit [Gammaproteobacteria bacterium]|nr:succinate dehydrogenase, cytochrome b556 subunit [Gammaproteobacteria bacterium]
MTALKSKRPVNLPLSQVISVNLKSPVAIASILHRISGVVLFLLIPALLYVLQRSLASPQEFDVVHNEIFGNICVRFVVWVFLAGLIYHLFAGIKHLFADIGVAEELESGRTAAWLMLAASGVGIVAAFIWVVL